MQSRELWLWLGGAFLTVALIFSGIAFALFTKEQNFSLYTSWQLIGTWALVILAFTSFLCAILGLPFRLRRRRFPNITIVSGARAQMMRRKQLAPGFVINVHPLMFNLTITNNETEKTISIRHAWLHAKRKEGSNSQIDDWIFPPERIPSELGIGTELEFPVVLEPQTSKAGWLLFDVNQHILPELGDPFDRLIRLVDANSHESGYFLAGAGIFSRGEGITTTRTWPSETEARNAAPEPHWSGVFGPPDPEGRPGVFGPPDPKRGRQR
jgi:hypothetical protein